MVIAAIAVDFINRKYIMLLPGCEAHSHTKIVVVEELLHAASLRGRIVNNSQN